MQNDNLFKEIWKILEDQPMLDPHTHLTASHLTARGLHDILLYHMVISDLYSAGCPDGARLSEFPDDNEAYSRLERAIPYVKYIQNTSCFWGTRIILKDLYGWDEPITESNWKKLDDIIRAKYADPKWRSEIIKRSNVKRFCTELARRGDSSFDNMCDYSLEWAFFTRAQWGCFDTALLELEYTWNMDEPGPPLPVTVNRAELNFKKVIKTVEDIEEALTHFCDKIPFDRVINMASHLSCDITYRAVTVEETAKALKNRDNAGETERDIYANYVFNRFLEMYRERKIGKALQFSLGAEPLPYETGAKMRTETVFELAQLFSRNPDINFNIHNASEHQNQAFCTLARELPNVSFTGFWWHNFFPGQMRKIFRQRLDMVALNKWVGFISDAYCLDWTYAKTIIIRTQMTEVLKEKILQGQYTLDTVKFIAEQILYETPKNLFDIKI